MGRSVLAALAVLAWGCLPAFEDECSDDEQCGAEERCAGGVCVPLSGPLPPDGGEPVPDGDVADAADAEPAVEICNGEDDDGNGVTDEGDLCPSVDGQPGQCLAGQCVYTCPVGAYDRDGNPANGCQRGCDGRDEPLVLVRGLSLDDQQIALAADGSASVVVWRLDPTDAGRGLQALVLDAVGRSVVLAENELGLFGPPSAAFLDDQVIVTAAVEGRQAPLDTASTALIVQSENARRLVGLRAPTPGAIESTSLVATDGRVAVVADLRGEDGTAGPVAWVGPVPEATGSETLAPVGARLPDARIPPVAFPAGRGFGVLRVAGGDPMALVDQRFGDDLAIGETSQIQLDGTPAGPPSFDGGERWALALEGIVLSGPLPVAQPDLTRAQAIALPEVVSRPQLLALPGGPALIYSAGPEVRVAFREAETWHVETVVVEDEGEIRTVVGAVVDDALRLAWITAEDEAGTLRFVARTCR